VSTWKHIRSTFENVFIYCRAPSVSPIHPSSVGLLKAVVTTGIRKGKRCSGWQPGGPPRPEPLPIHKCSVGAVKVFHPHLFADLRYTSKTAD
jgi:hypothetical protein